MKEQINSKIIKFVALLFFILVCSFLYKLYQLQVVDNKKFEALSSKQYYNLYSNKEKRGAIIFKYKDGGDFFAATNKTYYSVEINPTIIKNPEDTFNILSSIIEINQEEYFKKANKENDVSEIIAEGISDEDAQKIEELELSGLIVKKTNPRFYPGKNLAARVIGFQSYKGDEYSGRYGLERQYEKILNKEEEGLFKNFFVEIFSGIGDKLSSNKGTGSIVATIEPNVQTYTEEVLKKTNEKYSSEKTGAIIMNPQNGEILAMSISPNFDLNNFSEVDNVSIFNNESVEAVYEMGSIIKPITVAIGLDTNQIKSTTTYNDKGYLTLNTETIYNYDKRGRGVVDMQEVLNQSLNTGVAFIADKVGNKIFSDYMKKLLGQKSGIDLPNEVSPQISNLDSPRDIEHATASYGHGVAFTPIQTIRGLAALGNGGYLVKPHIVKSIRYDLGKEEDIFDNKKEQIFKNETSEEISRMLVNVVDEALLGGTASLPNYSIAAKTGTALVADQKSGGYYDDRYLHTFFGYFPAYDPQFIILLYTIEPKNVLYASSTLTEPFMDLAKYLINYYEIEPDR